MTGSREEQAESGEGEGDRPTGGLEEDHKLSYVSVRNSLYSFVSSVSSDAVLLMSTPAKVTQPVC